MSKTITDYESYKSRRDELLESVQNESIKIGLSRGDISNVRLMTEEWIKAISVARMMRAEGVGSFGENFNWILEHTSYGEVAFDEETETIVPIDVPLVIESKSSNSKKGYYPKTKSTVKFDSPSRANDKEDKAYKVYRPAKGYHTTSSGKKIRKAKAIYFGDPDSPVRNYDKDAARSFRKRHNCSSKSDKDTPGWWSCNIHRYADQVGLSSTNPW